eukprot:COSAG03_NODE_3455_length_2000_cov_1.214098_1_plen_55_part_10
MEDPELDAALEAAWAERSAVSLAGPTLAGVIANEKSRSFSSEREREALKQMKPGL